MNQDAGIIKIEKANGGSAIHAEIEIRGNIFPIWFRAKGAELYPNLEAFLALALIPAMKARCGVLHADGEIDHAFFEGYRGIQAIYKSWWKRLEVVKLEGVSKTDKAALQTNRTAAFFSGGVDSFYTAVKHQPKIDSLVFVHGLDIPLQAADHRKKAVAAVHRAAVHFGKPVIEIETNARSFLNKFDSLMMTEGSLLACLGYLLAPDFDTILIPGSQNPYDIEPFSTHILVDQLWRSNQLKFINDGYEANRIQKAEILGNQDAFLSNLRVCTHSGSKNLNCGRCGKCLSTMCSLAAAGILERCNTFDTKLEPQSLINGLALDYYDWRLNVELAYFEENQVYPEIANALRKILTYYRPLAWGYTRLKWLLNYLLKKKKFA